LADFWILLGQKWPEEGIAANALANGLKCLVVFDLLSAGNNPADRKKAIYAAGKDAQFRARRWHERSPGGLVIGNGPGARL